MNRRDWFLLFFCLLLPNIVGISAAFFTAPGVTEWYPALLKPLWTPPDWVFGPVWSMLYITMGFALFLVLRAKPSPYRQAGIIMFTIQLMLNFMWSVFFFGMKNPALAMLDLVALWLAVAAMIWLFFEIRTLAGAILWPYLIWVTFAGCLNYFIWVLN